VKVIALSGFSVAGQTTLVERFGDFDLRKIEVWRAQTGKFALNEG